jgi:hypothetical protein
MLLCELGRQRDCNQEKNDEPARVYSAAGQPPIPLLARWGMARTSGFRIARPLGIPIYLHILGPHGRLSL